MFGKNIPIKPVNDADGKQLNIVGIFHTIQGEGPFSGQPAVFIRTAGCNLRCFFCDTDFETGAKEKKVEAIVDDVLDKAGSKTHLVVLTGGEPMAQNIVPLCEALVDEGFTVQIETAGTVWPTGLSYLCSSGNVVLVCSPKTSIVHKKVQRSCQHYKYIVRAGELDVDDGLPTYSTQEQGKLTELFRPKLDLSDRTGPITVWLSPCDEYKDPYMIAGASLLDRNEFAYRANVAAVLASSLKHGYRISLQTHKILGVE